MLKLFQYLIGITVNGKIVKDGVVYGCVNLDIGFLKGLVKNNICDNRAIESITLDSDVVISMDNIKEIIDYTNHI